MMMHKEFEVVHSEAIFNLNTKATHPAPLSIFLSHPPNQHRLSELSQTRAFFSPKILPVLRWNICPELGSSYSLSPESHHVDDAPSLQDFPPACA